MTTVYLAAATAVQVVVPAGKGDPTWLENDALKKQFIPAIFETLQMVGLSTLFAVIIGTLIGLVLVQTGKGGLTPNKGVYQAVSFVVNIVRSLPFIIGIIVLIPVTVARPAPWLRSCPSSSSPRPSLRASWRRTCWPSIPARSKPPR